MGQAHVRRGRLRQGSLKQGATTQITISKAKPMHGNTRAEHTIETNEEWMREEAVWGNATHVDAIAASAVARSTHGTHRQCGASQGGTR